MKKHTTTSPHPPTTRIRVLPGTCLPIATPPPPPPSTPPPQPVHLCKIAIIGDPSSGKSSLVNKFLLRKSADVNSEGGVVQWCNASATSLGTFGSAVGASSSPGVTGGVETDALAEYYKKDIALKQQRVVMSGEESEDNTTCVRAQVWDVNVPQSALIINGQGQNNGHGSCNDHDFSPERIQSSSNTINSTSSSYISSSSSPTIQSQQYSASSDNLANLAPLLPLLKRLNVIIIACQCPSPPLSTTTTQQQFSPVSSNASYHSQASRRITKNDQVEWVELDMLERQIELWIRFIHGNISMDGGAKSNGGSGGNSSNSSNDNNSQTPYTIAIMLTFADLAITEYSPKEWMRLSVKMKEICDKFGIYSWRMGTCVSSSADLNNRSEKNNVANDESMQYGMFQRMAQQQQQMMEEAEDSVEGLFIDMILSHLDDGT